MDRHAGEGARRLASSAPDPLATGTNCGALTAGVNYALELEATGDAGLQMWKLVNGSY